ncbi:hypothetical protein PNEG_02561 [Pneumocystis murina B123]|uniref:Mitochondrial carrier protein n=1 Tax=Pneumocystis murina (strain B123) TaxID=1069680 RepID=M7P5U0_PNEMU|nr:hypothetical protein PNEG_02561 [Pneumocystis murina B123]EMR09225.1 hypothetical protein PNEG_02561 [Pneumocystis murina B123]
MKPFLETALASIIAGFMVDIILFPLDTMKTWTQEEKKNMNKNEYKVFKQGMKRNIYSGLGGMIMGSIPSSFVFFTIYETTRSILIEDEYKKIINKTWNIEKDVLLNKNESKMSDLMDRRSMILSCSFAACLSELAACIVRMPSEVIKQRTQAGQYSSSWEAFVDIFPGKKNQRYGGLYCGFVSTIIRDIPFSVLQFPLWEILKQKMSENSNIKILSNISIPFLGETTLSSTLQSAISGSIASSIAAALTTPLDVVKTRTILSQTKPNWINCATRIVKEEGIRALFKGIIFRITWISMGGALFLGTYDGVHGLISNLSNQDFKQNF